MAADDPSPLRLPAGAAAAALAAAAVTAHAAVSAPLASVTRVAADTQASLRQVSYGGYTFQVPQTWPVIDLADHRRVCVQFDRHVVYLGVPGRDQACPSGLVGTTEALLIQPSAARAASRFGGVSG